MEIYVAEIPSLAGFTGKERDVETGLDYFGARYYDYYRLNH
jgi:RHS repeat-associated protein